MTKVINFKDLPFDRKIFLIGLIIIGHISSGLLGPLFLMIECDIPILKTLWR